MKRALILILPMLVLAGCATGTPTGAPSSQTPSETPVTTPSLPRPTGTTPSKNPGEITVVGTVEEGVERGCKVLRTSGELYSLMGSSDPRITPGARLSVRGRVRTDVATTCQQGTVFQVLDVQPA